MLIGEGREMIGITDDILPLCARYYLKAKYRRLLMHASAHPRDGPATEGDRLLGEECKVIHVKDDILAIS